MKKVLIIVGILLISGLLIAFVNIYFSVKELIHIENLQKDITRGNLSFVIALSAVSATYINVSIKSIGGMSVLISAISGILIFLISMIIIQDEQEGKNK